MLKNFDIILITLILSPGLSIIYYLSGVYFPNDKIAMILVFFVIISKENISHFLIKKTFIFFALLSICFSIRFFVNNELPTVSDYNILITYTILPFFAAVLAGHLFFLETIKKYAWLAIAVGLAQQILMNIGAESIISSLMTYPAQVTGEYKFDPWAPYLYRVSGLQLESSQYSFLLSFIFFLLRIHKNTTNLILMLAIVCSILINGSTAGYIGLFLSYILTTHISLASITFMMILFSCLTIAAFYFDLLESQIEKINIIYTIITSGLSSAELMSDRVQGILNMLPYFNFMNLTFGMGLMFRGGHDFISVTVLGIGLVGAIVLANLWYSFKPMNSSKILLLLLFFCISTGSFLDPVYEFIFIYFVTFHSKINGKNHNYYSLQK